MAGAHVFVADLDAPELTPEDRHHLARVLRLCPGDELTVSDGAGGHRQCRFGPTLEAAGDVAHDVRPDPPVVVAFALAKGERPEWAVQKLTELGVDRIVPITAARSVVRWTPHRAAAHMARLRRVAREAAMQSRRSWMPEVDDVTSFASVGALPGAVLADPDGRPPKLGEGPVLVGPEGGWAPEELAVGLPHVALGHHVLRVETAAVAVAAILAALRAGLVSERSDAPNL